MPSFSPISNSRLSSLWIIRRFLQPPGNYAYVNVHPSLSPFPLLFSSGSASSSAESLPKQPLLHSLRAPSFSSRRFTLGFPLSRLQSALRWLRTAWFRRRRDFSSLLADRAAVQPLLLLGCCLCCQPSPTQLLSALLPAVALLRCFTSRQTSSLERHWHLHPALQPPLLHSLLMYQCVVQPLNAAAGHAQETPPLSASFRAVRVPADSSARHSADRIPR